MSAIQSVLAKPPSVLPFFQFAKKHEQNRRQLELQQRELEEKRKKFEKEKEAFMEQNKISEDSFSSPNAK